MADKKSEMEEQRKRHLDEVERRQVDASRKALEELLRGNKTIMSKLMGKAGRKAESVADGVNVSDEGKMAKMLRGIRITSAVLKDSGKAVELWKQNSPLAKKRFAMQRDQLLEQQKSLQEQMAKATLENNKKQADELKSQLEGSKADLSDLEKTRAEADKLFGWTAKSAWAGQRKEIEKMISGSQQSIAELLHMDAGKTKARKPDPAPVIVADEAPTLEKKKRKAAKKVADEQAKTIVEGQAEVAEKQTAKMVKAGEAVDKKQERREKARARKNEKFSDGKEGLDNRSEAQRKLDDLEKRMMSREGVSVAEGDMGGGDFSDLVGRRTKAKRPPRAGKAGKLGKLGKLAGGAAEVAETGGTAATAAEGAGAAAAGGGALATAATVGVGLAVAAGATAAVNYAVEGGLFGENMASQYSIGDMFSDWFGDGQRNIKRAVERAKKKALDKADEQFKSFKNEAGGPWARISDSHLSQLKKPSYMPYVQRYYELWMRENEYGSVSTTLTEHRDADKIPEDQKQQATDMWRAAMKARIQYKKDYIEQDGRIGAEIVDTKADVREMGQADQKAASGAEQASRDTRMGSRRTGAAGVEQQPPSTVTVKAQQQAGAAGSTGVVVPAEQTAAGTTAAAQANKAAVRATQAKQQDTRQQQDRSDDLQDLKKWLISDFIPKLAQAMGSQQQATPQQQRQQTGRQPAQAGSTPPIFR